jgi:uncharacterized membrane protein YesL
LRYAFTRAIQDWYYGLIPFAALNFVWLLLVLTVVGGPPATAAMLAVARDAAIGYGAEPKNFYIYLKQYFRRAWGLGIVTFLGSVILVTDLGFYADALGGNPVLFNAGIFFLLYVLIVWLEVLLVAWPLMVNQPEMSIRDVMRNAVVVTLRTPGAAFGLALLVVILCLFSLALAVLVALALAAIASLLAQHYLHFQAPVLANFPPTVGEAAAQAPIVESDEE